MLVLDSSAKLWRSQTAVDKSGGVCESSGNASECCGVTNQLRNVNSRRPSVMRVMEQSVGSNDRNIVTAPLKDGMGFTCGLLADSSIPWCSDAGGVEFRAGEFLQISG